MEAKTVGQAFQPEPNWQHDVVDTKMLVDFVPRGIMYDVYGVE